NPHCQGRGGAVQYTGRYDMSRTDQVTRIARHLERAILAGELAPGELLPSERDISRQMQASRSAVREALGRLASLGLGRRVRGSGTRVEAASAGPVTEGYQRLLRRSDVRLEDLAAVRTPLETAIAALAARKRGDEHLARMRAAQEVLGAAPAGLEAHVKADLD